MTSLPEKLRLKGMAEEDMYFARRDRELIAALRQRRLAGLGQVQTQQGRRATQAKSTRRNAPAGRKSVRSAGRESFYRRLIARALKLLQRHRH